MKKIVRVVKHPKNKSSRTRLFTTTLLKLTAHWLTRDLWAEQMVWAAYGMEAGDW